MNQPTPKIFYIGLSRSGTTSLYEILQQLGYNTTHFCHCLFEKPDWEESRQFDAMGDSPIPHLYKECDQHFPGSKFILVIRQKKSWLKSMKWLFTHGKVIWNWSPMLNNYHQEFYGTSRYKKKILSKHWDTYHQDVKKYFADRPDDLLTLHLEDGIDVKKICAFLGQPYREVNIPHSNQKRKAKLKKRIKYFLRQRKAARIHKSTAPHHTT